MCVSNSGGVTSKPSEERGISLITNKGVVAGRRECGRKQGCNGCGGSIESVAESENVMAGSRKCGIEEDGDGVLRK